MEIVRVEKLSKSFGSLSVLKNISFGVGRGEVVAVIGPSGSGKSTLLRCIAHLETVDSGTIMVDGDISRFRNGLLHGARGLRGRNSRRLNCSTAIPNGGRTGSCTGTGDPRLSPRAGPGRNSGITGNWC